MYVDTIYDLCINAYTIHYICPLSNIFISMPISKEKDGNIGKLFIHSSHVLSEAEQILLEYLDQPKSKNSSKCKYKMHRFNILT